MRRARDPDEPFGSGPSQRPGVCEHSRPFTASSAPRFPVRPLQLSRATPAPCPPPRPTGQALPLGEDNEVGAWPKMKGRGRETQGGTFQTHLPPLLQNPPARGTGGQLREHTKDSAHWPKATSSLPPPPPGGGAVSRERTVPPGRPLPGDPAASGSAAKWAPAPALQPTRANRSHQTLAGPPLPRHPATPPSMAAARGQEKAQQEGTAPRPEESQPPSSRLVLRLTPTEGRGVCLRSPPRGSRAPTVTLGPSIEWCLRDAVQLLGAALWGLHSGPPAAL